MAGLVASLAVAATVVALEPVTGPWTTYADADATYVASGLNILKGTHSRYYDHPGLPVQQLLAVTFGASYAVGRVTGNDTSVNAYVDQKLTNLDTTRPYFRGLAIALYLLGAGLSYVLFGRLFGGRLW